MLQNNGGDDLSITEDGTHRFPVQVEDGRPYSVTILSRPALQNCVVTNGIGSISGADVADVLADCTDKSWKDPVDLTEHINPVAEAVGDLAVAMDDEGNTLVTWRGRVSDAYAVFRSEYRGGVWAHPPALSDSVGIADNSFYDPKPAMDSQGNALIAWYNGDNDGIFLSEYRNGTWNDPDDLTDRVDLPGDDGGTEPRVAMNDSGDAIIQWQAYLSGGFTGFFANVYRDGAWHYPDGVDDFINIPGFAAYTPEIAIDGNGEALVVWDQEDDLGTRRIYKSELRETAPDVWAWDTPDDRSDYFSEIPTNAYDPMVAMNENGEAIVVWRQDDGVRHQIFKAEYRNATWSAPSDSSDNLSPDEASADRPDVAMNDEGEVVVVWRQSDGSNPQVFRAEYYDGAWIQPTGLNDNLSPDGKIANFPKVAMDKHGNAVVTWQQYDADSERQIFRSEYRLGTWTIPSGLADNISPDGTAAVYPEVAMSDNGDAVIAWEQDDGSAGCGGGGCTLIMMSEFR